MALSFRSALQRLAPIQSRVVSLATANPGLLVLVISLVAAGVLAFYLVILPPGTVSYP
jgi:hypothetical protein